jgi:hypothetical protein
MADAAAPVLVALHFDFEFALANKDGDVEIDVQTN